MQRDDESLMLGARDPINGSLKVTACITETDRNIMKAMRNPTAHEPALEWPISNPECLDFLKFISFMWSQLDKGQYHKRP
jgi:hypothetical protein